MTISEAIPMNVIIIREYYNVVMVRLPKASMFFAENIIRITQSKNILKCPENNFQIKIFDHILL